MNANHKSEQAKSDCYASKAKKKYYFDLFPKGHL